MTHFTVFTHWSDSPSINLMVSKWGKWNHSEWNFALQQHGRPCKHSFHASAVLHDAAPASSRNGVRQPKQACDAAQGIQPETKRAGAAAGYTNKHLNSSERSAILRQGACRLLARKVCLLIRLDGLFKRSSFYTRLHAVSRTENLGCETWQTCAKQNLCNMLCEHLSTS